MKQFQKFFELDGVDLEFDRRRPAGCGPEGDGAEDRGQGLRTIMEDILLDVMYDIPSDDNVKRCIITEAVIEGKEPPRLIRSTGRPTKKKSRLEASAGSTVKSEGVGGFLSPRRFSGCNPAG